MKSPSLQGLFVVGRGVISRITALQELPKAANTGLPDTPLFAAFGSSYRREYRSTTTHVNESPRKKVKIK